jgi:hypothetical protein
LAVSAGTSGSVEILLSRYFIAETAIS